METATNGIRPPQAAAHLPAEGAMESDSSQAAALDTHRNDVRQTVMRLKAGARKKYAKYKKLNDVFWTLKLVCGILVAGLPGVAWLFSLRYGEAFGDQLPGGWPGLCLATSALGVVAVVIDGVTTKFQFAETVTMSEGCVTDLENLLLDFSESDMRSVTSRVKQIRQANRKVLLEEAD